MVFEIKSRFLTVLIQHETQFSVCFTNEGNNFSRLLLSANRIGDQDRRIYDFYRLPVILNRDQERYNFLKLFTTGKRANMVKTLHESHMHLFEPKSKNQPSEIRLDHYGVVQCIQHLDHNGKLSAVEKGGLHDIQKFLDDVEVVFEQISLHYASQTNPFRDYPSLDKSLSLSNRGRGCYLLLLGIVNGLLAVMVGKSSDLPKRIAQHKRRFCHLKLLSAATTNDELSLERKAKKILELHGASLLNSTSTETYIVTSAFTIDDFITRFKQATEEDNGSELLEVERKEQNPEAQCTPGKQRQSQKVSPIVVQCSPDVKALYHQVLQDHDQKRVEEYVEASLKHAFEGMQMSSNKRQHSAE